MTAVLAALSLTDEIEKYGAYAGLAAVVGLGVLSLLYFAQAREVKRLREWAGRAPERDSELQQRVVAEAQTRSAAPGPGGPAQPATAAAAASPPAAPPGPRPALPGPATAAVAASAAGQAVPAPAASPATVSASAQVPTKTPASAAAGSAPPATQPGAKAPAAGTTPPAAPGATPPAKAPAAGTTPSAAPGATPPAKPPAAGATPPAAPPATPPAAPGATPPAKPPAAGATPPAAPPAPGTPVPAPPAVAPSTPAAAAPGQPHVASAAPPRPRAAPGPARATVAAAGGPVRSRRPAPDAPPAHARRNVFAVVFGGVALIAIAALLVTQVFGGDEGPPQKPNTVGQASDEGADTSGSTAAPLDRAETTVSVLNGTTVTGLARGAMNRVLERGYREGIVVTNTDQTVQKSVIHYAQGSRRQALDVAKIIGVGRDALRSMDQNARVLGADAPVVVIIGADRAQ